MEIAKTGKSAAIRIKVGQVDKFAPFDSQKDIVIEGLSAARKLLKLGQELSDKL